MDLAKRNNLIVTSKDEVRTYWHLVKPGLEYMCKEGRNPDKWMPEDVFESLKNGNANLVFTSIMRGADKGFRYTSREAAIADSSGFIVVHKVNSFSDSALHIWIAVSNDTTKKSDAGSIMRAFNDELSALAKESGCQTITFASNQSWWEKIAPRFGFAKQETKYSKAVK